VQLLLDTFIKEKYLNLDYKMMIPSNSTIMYEVGTLYPQFHSRGTRCGMMTVALSLAGYDLPQSLLSYK